VRARLSAERGFTLIETMVAVGVLAISLFALAYTATIGFADIGFARQRQSATGLADQAIEQARALPFETLKKGLSSNDATIAGDPNITACGANKCYGGEQIPLSGYAVGTTITPLVPHKTTVVVGPTTFTVSLYTTYYQGVTTSNTIRITAIVTWTNAQRKGVPAKVITQTVAFSPSGCESTATHPFAAPCQPFLYATQSNQPGHIDVTGTISGVDLNTASLWTAGTESDMQIEQISAVAGYAQTAGASIKFGNGSQQTVGLAKVTSGSDNDPGQSDPDFQTNSGTAQSSSSVSTSGSGNSLTLTSSAGDTTKSSSTVLASVSPSRPCPNITGVTDQNDSLPCSGSAAQQLGTETTTLTIGPGGSALGDTILASIGAAPAAQKAITDRAVAPETAACLTTSGDGCLHAEGSRAVGTVTLAGLPSVLSGGSLPVGWNGSLIQVTGYSDSVSAESGVGTAAPSVTRTGTISYYNGTGYTSCTVGSTCPGGNLPVAPLVLVTTAHGNPLLINVSATVQQGSAPTSSTSATCSPTPCPNTRTAGSATANSPLTGDITYTINYSGSVVATLNIHVDLGTLLAQVSYKQSPSGA
jgi:prepilin-type N-terminal cleavage/methylation domain-containing protein